MQESAQNLKNQTKDKFQYKNKKLRLATASGVWQVDLYENSTTTLVQPMVDKQTVSSPCDTLQFESYSVVNGPATYHWSFSFLARGNNAQGAGL